MSNFACLGVRTEQECTALLDQAVEAAEPWEGRPLHRLWRDPSGARLAIHFSRPGEIRCITPFFEAEVEAEVPPEAPSPWDLLLAGPTWRVRTVAPLLDKECLDCSGTDCDVLDESGDLVTRTSVQWAWFRPYRDWLKQERTYDLRVVAFAHELQVFADEEAFDASPEARLSEEPEAPRFSIRSFLPLGMFATGKVIMRERATAIFGGPILAAARRRNRSTGHEFAQLRVEALPGPVDVVFADPQVVDAPPGSLAWVKAWLVGTPGQPPPPEEPPRPGFWARLLGRRG